MACLGSPIRNSPACASPSASKMRRKIRHWRGSVSWNSSTSSIGQRWRSAAQKAGCSLACQTCSISWSWVRWLRSANACSKRAPASARSSCSQVARSDSPASGNSRRAGSHNLGRLLARASGADHKRHRQSKPCASPLLATRHRSAATSPHNSPALSMTSSSFNAPARKPNSRSARWQKPWMVEIAASSSCNNAACRRRSSVASSMPVDRACAISAAVCNASSPSTLSPANRRSAMRRRRRTRSRSSAVAARVKVTTSSFGNGTPPSSSRRSSHAVRVKVLPVPALASIR